MAEQNAPNLGRSFLKLPRTVARELLGHPNALVVYVALLERAAYQAGVRRLRSRGVISLEAGQCVFGRRELAIACGIGERPTRDALKVLQDVQYVSLKPSHLGTVATIRGYGEIADTSGDEGPTPRPADVPPDVQQTSHSPSTNVEVKKERRKDVEKRVSGVHRLRDFWVSRYKIRHGDDYVVLPADYKLLKQLEGSPGVDEAERRMQVAFDAPPSFPPQPWPLRTFVNNINACAKPTEARAAKDVRTGRVEPQTDPTAYGDGDQDL